MPPKKVNLKSVTKPITNHFKQFTPLKIAPLRAQELQLEIAQDKIQKEKEGVQREEDEKIRNERRDVIATLISSTSNMRIEVVNTVDEVIQNLGNNVEIAKFQVTKPKKNYKKNLLNGKK